jgi:tryptophan-rich hypothetical protein
MTEAPHRPDRLVGSAWTAVDIEDDRKHWEVVEYRAGAGTAVLRALHDDTRRELPWRELRDRARWRPGWK